MRKRAMLCLITAIAFATYSVWGVSMSYAAPKTAVVEVKPGTLTGKVTDMDEKPLAGKTIKVVDALGAVKYKALTAEDGTYSVADLKPGTYTLIMADSQKVSLVVTAESTNTIVNAMLPANLKPYAAGAIGAPVIVAIAGGVILVGVAVYGITQYDSDEHTPLIPSISP